jgi:hypothetical protein
MQEEAGLGAAAAEGAGLGAAPAAGLAASAVEGTALAARRRPAWERRSQPGLEAALTKIQLLDCRKTTERSVAILGSTHNKEYKLEMTRLFDNQHTYSWLGPHLPCVTCYGKTWIYKRYDEDTESIDASASLLRSSSVTTNSLSLSRITSIESISAPSSFTIGTFSASTFNFSPEEKKEKRDSILQYFN